MLCTLNYKTVQAWLFFVWLWGRCGWSFLLLFDDADEADDLRRCLLCPLAAAFDGGSPRTLRTSETWQWKTCTLKRNVVKYGKYSLAISPNFLTVLRYHVRHCYDKMVKFKNVQTLRGQIFHTLIICIYNEICITIYTSISCSPFFSFSSHKRRICCWKITIRTF